MKTYSLKAKDINKKWYLIDAEGIVLGRLASKIATILKGKNKTTYTPHLDCGDNVVVINAEKIVYNGKADDKIYYHYSGFQGGLKETTLPKMLEKKPESVLQLAVKGMLGKNPLGRQQMRNLRIYAGATHEQAAQLPEKIEFQKTIEE